MTSAIERWLVDAQGRCLEQVYGELYEGCQPAENESPIAIWIQFLGTKRARLVGNPDGWGIGLDDAPPTASDMGSAGRTVIQNMNKKRPFLQCMESPLREAAVLTSTGSEEPVGVRLGFESGGVLLILSWGDELFLGDRPPRDATLGDLIICPVEKTE